MARLSESLPPQVIVTRGDACLPNFLYQGGGLSGYVDVGDMTIGEPEVDLAAAVWSLQYNLGPGYGLNFLREYGRQDADDEDVERLPFPIPVLLVHVRRHVSPPHCHRLRRAARLQAVVPGGGVHE